MSDWDWTQDARQRGFQARPVVGGVFLQMLDDKVIWQKWAAREQTQAANWAPMPVPPEVRGVVPTAEGQPILWRYTTRPPEGDWFQPDFDVSGRRSTSPERTCRTYTQHSALKPPLFSKPFTIVRIHNHPDMCTENNWCRPNRDRAERPFLVAAYGSMIGG